MLICRVPIQNPPPPREFFNLADGRVPNLLSERALRRQHQAILIFLTPKNRHANALGMQGECARDVPGTSLECTTLAPESLLFVRERAHSGFFWF
jgi:hypothetical protein